MGGNTLQGSPVRKVAQSEIRHRIASLSGLAIRMVTLWYLIRSFARGVIHKLSSFGKVLLKSLYKFTIHALS